MAESRCKVPRAPVFRAKAPGGDLFEVARQVTDATGCPVVGGVAVALYGGSCYRSEIDIFARDVAAAHRALERAGIGRVANGPEHRIDGVSVRVLDEGVLGARPRRSVRIEGVRVIRLVDLVAMKIAAGLEKLVRAKHLAHVIELIRWIPLKKEFAANLPPQTRAPFRELVEQVHNPHRKPISPMAFLKKYA